MKNRKELTCVKCSKVFVGHPRRKFCSDDCKFVEKNCLMCGTSFKKEDKVKFCSDKCRCKFNKALHRPSKEEISAIKEKKSAEKKERDTRLIEEKARKKSIKLLVATLKKRATRYCNCAECGQEFVKNEGGLGYKYCSTECKRKANKEQRKAYPRVNKEARLSKNGKADYSITLKKLYERDGGVCHICNRATSYDDFIITEEEYFIAGNNYPSIDHVLAINNGGLHQWNNVKLAHRICNSRKSDKLISYQTFLEI